MSSLLFALIFFGMVVLIIIIQLECGCEDDCEDGSGHNELFQDSSQDWWTNPMYKDIPGNIYYDDNDHH